MAEAIAKAEAEGALDDFEENDDRMQHQQSGGAGDGSLLQRGL